MYLILFWVLASCGRPVPSLYQDKTISLHSAEKTEWVGGRAGVRGTMYTIILKKNNTGIVTVKTLRAEGNIIPFTQNNIGNTITLRGNFQHSNDEDTRTADQAPSGISTENPVPQKLHPKDNWIEYTVKSSQKLHRINISKFTAVESSEEPAP